MHLAASGASVTLKCRAMNQSTKVRTSLYLLEKVNTCGRMFLSLCSHTILENMQSVSVKVGVEVQHRKLSSKTNISLHRKLKYVIKNRVSIIFLQKYDEYLLRFSAVQYP
jgi:hypothetical protein